MAIACCGSACAQTLTGTATITDADTIVIGGETIRLQGVDAPETDQICLDSRGAVWNCGIDARDRLIQHIGSRETSCVTNGKDAFGRWLATCSTNEGDLSTWLVHEGLGMAFIRYSNAYVAEEAIARSAQKGMWAGAFIAPWDWRARTVSTAILGSYRPTEQQERLLLPSTPQLRPQPSLSPLAQLQEQRGACVIIMSHRQQSFCFILSLPLLLFKETRQIPGHTRADVALRRRFAINYRWR
jgi:endonuclease YncB( thermonuclease family)